MVYEAYKKGEAQYKYAVNYVNKYAKGADKTKYLADLSNTRNKYLLGRALNYIKSFNALELKVEPAATKAQDAIADAKKVEEVEAAQAEFKKVWDAQQKDLRAVVESNIEATILEFAQEAADAVEAAADAKIEELKKAEEEGKKVKEVSAVADKEINEGEALPALPATVEVTLNNGEKAQKAVVWNTSAVDTSKPATYEVTGVVADTDLTAKVSVVVKAVAPQVTGVSAINATTLEVEFNKEVKAEDGFKFSVAGTEVAAGKVAFAGKVATVTVAAIADDASVKVEVKDSKGTELYNKDVKYDLNQITSITPVNSNYTAQVGKEITVQYKVVDEDGDAIANTEVFVRAASNLPALSNIERTVKTDANGIASFTINRSEVSTDTLTAYVVDRPVVASNGAVTVRWNVAPTGLVSVDATNNVDLGAGTYKEYNVSVKNQNGTDFTGTLYMDIATTGLTAGQVTTQFWNGTAWVNATGTGTAQVSHTLTAANEGKVKFRVLGAAGVNGTVQPTFFYDLGTTVGSLQDADPRIIASKVTYVTQQPTLTFTEDATGDTIATSAVANSTTDSKLYSLKAVDQFGNPYRGTVNLSDFGRVDGLAATPANANIRFALDTDANNVFDIVGANTQALNFAVGGSDADNNSEVKVRVTNATAEKVTPVAYVDVANPAGSAADVANILDSNDVKVVGDEVTSQARVGSTVTSEVINPGNIAVGGSKYVKFTFVDQFGAPFIPTGNLELALEGAGLGTTVIDAIDTSYVAADNATFGFNVDQDTNAASVANQTAISNVIAVKVSGGAASNASKLRVWIDAQNDSLFQADEVNGISDTITFVAGALTSGAFANATSVNDAVVNTSDNGSVVVSDLAGDDNVGVSYVVQDQAGQDLNLGSPVNVLFTVKNTSTTTAVTVTDTAGATLGTVAAGATGTFTVATTDNGTPADAANIRVASAAANTVKVTGQIEGISSSAKSQDIIWTGNVLAANQTYTGTVLAVNKTADWLLLDTAVGNVLVSDYSAAGTFTTTYTVGGNTASDAQFETNLTVGDSVKVTTGATTNAIELTNK